jgi:hypothetical protein
MYEQKEGGSYSLSEMLPALHVPYFLPSRALLAAMARRGGTTVPRPRLVSSSFESDATLYGI